MREDGEKVLRDLVRNKIAANATGEREIGQFQMKRAARQKTHGSAHFRAAFREELS